MLTGLCSLVSWPYLTGAYAWDPAAKVSRPDWLFGAFQFNAAVLWSALAAKLVAGRAAAEEQWGSLRTPVPTLPVGIASRALGEALLATLILVIARTPGLFVGDWLQGRRPGLYEPWIASGAGYFWKRTLVGAVLTFPVILAWACPFRNMNTVFRRPFAVALTLMVAMKLGVLTSIAGCAAVSGTLVAILLATLGRDWTIPVRWRWRTDDAASRWRAANVPERQFLRDLFFRPLPSVAVIVSVEIVVILLDRYVFHGGGNGGPEVMAIGSAFVILALYSYLPTYPLGQIVVLQAFRAGGGTLLRTLSTLPLRRQTAIRGIYLYSLLSAIAVWGFAMGLVYLSSRLHPTPGTVSGPEASRGITLGLLSLAIPLTTAGLVASGAAGARVRGVLGVVSTVGIAAALLILASSHGSLNGAVAAIIALAIVGGVPALGVLRVPSGEGEGGDS